MDDFLYLDTARFGRPTPGTLRAATDSFRLAAEEGGSAHFDAFLRVGFGECPAWLADRYPGLRAWRGVAGLKADLRRLVGCPPERPVLLANRSHALMGFASRLLYAQCRNVLVCDLGWPGYHEILHRHANQLGRRVTRCEVREVAFRGTLSAVELTHQLVQRYRHDNCDGLFLPAVSNLGVRFPVAEIVRAIEAVAEVRFVVVDGAQELCHTAVSLDAEYCDLYLAGCHKWLAGHFPLGLAFYGHRRSVGQIDTLLGCLRRDGQLDDPLLALTDDLESGASSPFSETVALSGLFTAQAAVSESLSQGSLAEIHERQNAARMEVVEQLGDTPWQPMDTHPTLHSAILMVQAASTDLRTADPQSVRATLRDRGLGLTVYPHGVARLSLPVSSPQVGLAQRIRNGFLSIL